MFPGESFQSLQYSHRISKQSISSFVPQVCDALYQSLKDKYLKVHVVITCISYHQYKVIANVDIKLVIYMKFHIRTCVKFTMK